MMINQIDFDLWGFIVKEYQMFTKRMLFLFLLDNRKSFFLYSQLSAPTNLKIRFTYNSTYNKIHINVRFAREVTH